MMRSDWRPICGAEKYVYINFIIIVETYWHRAMKLGARHGRLDISRYERALARAIFDFTMTAA